MPEALTQLCHKLLPEPCNKRQEDQNWQTLRRAVCLIADILEVEGDKKPEPLKLQEGRLIKITDGDEGEKKIEVKFCEENTPQDGDMVKYNASGDCWEAVEKAAPPPPLEVGCGLKWEEGKLSIDNVAMSESCGTNPIGELFMEPCGECGLKINPYFLTGCGLSIDPLGRLNFDADKIIKIGLMAYPGGCGLVVPGPGPRGDDIPGGEPGGLTQDDLGCGLVINAKGKLQVDASELAGHCLQAAVPLDPEFERREYIGCDPDPGDECGDPTEGEGAHAGCCIDLWLGDDDADEIFLGGNPGLAEEGSEFVTRGGESFIIGADEITLTLQTKKIKIFRKCLCEATEDWIITAMAVEVGEPLVVTIPTTDCPEDP